MLFDTVFFQISYILKIKIDTHLAVNWACELLKHGNDTYYLRFLAGMHSEKMLREETWEIVGKILDELQVPPLSHEEAAKIYLIRILNSHLENKFPVLHILYDLCIKNENHDLFYPFYSLSTKLDRPYCNENDIYDQIDIEIRKLLYFLVDGEKALVSAQLHNLRF